MVEAVAIIAMISIVTGVISFKYSDIKIKTIEKRMERPDLIRLEKEE